MGGDVQNAAKVDCWRSIMTRPWRKIEPEKFFDPEGLFSVCRSCHIELTRSENLKRHAEQNPKRAAWQKFRDELLSS